MFGICADKISGTAGTRREAMACGAKCARVEVIASCGNANDLFGMLLQREKERAVSTFLVTFERSDRYVLHDDHKRQTWASYVVRDQHTQQ